MEQETIIMLPKECKFKNTHTPIYTHTCAHGCMHAHTQSFSEAANLQIREGKRSHQSIEKAYCFESKKTKWGI